MNTFILSTITKLFSILGIQIWFSKKSNHKTFFPILFDREMVEYYFTPNNRIGLYYEGLKQTNMEWSDNFPKQCRYYSLQQKLCVGFGDFIALLEYLLRVFV